MNVADSYQYDFVEFRQKNCTAPNQRLENDPDTINRTFLFKKIQCTGTGKLRYKKITYVKRINRK